MSNFKKYDLTNPQKSILVTEQFYEGSSINNICGTAFINEEIDAQLLKKAIVLFLNRNDVFRFMLCLDDEGVKQYVSDDVNSEVVFFEVNDYDDFVNKRKDIVSKPFNLFDSFLYNIYVFRFPNGHGGFIVNVHHVLADSWTLGIVSRDIVKLYSCLKNGSSCVDDAVFSYEEFIQSERDYLCSKRFEKDKAYWESRFASVPEVASVAPVKDSFVAQNSVVGNRKIFSLDFSTIDLIRSYCKSNSVSLYNFFMAVLAVYVSEISGLDDFVIGTPVLNRSGANEKSTAGMFVATQAFRICFDGLKDFSSLVKAISRDSLNMLKHQRYPYQDLIKFLRDKNANLPNLYNILFSYQITNATDLNDGVNYSTEWTFNGSCADDLAVHIFDLNDSGELNIAYDYKIDLFSLDDIDNLHKRLVCIISQVLGNYDIALSDIEVVTPDEKLELVSTFNQTRFDYDRNVPVIKFFEDQVSLHPDDIALVFENSSMSYRVLNERANSLAFLLRSKGVTNNSVVGILENRSFEMIIAILAVLKSGGCYIPIAPDYPVSRIKFMLDNSHACFLLTDSSLNDKVQFSGEVVFTDLNDNPIYASHKENLVNISKPDDLSYVIYTSGSTGTPKGVMLSQMNLTNFYHSMVRCIDFLTFERQPKFVSITTLSFDIFIFETLISLTRGLKLFITNYYEQKITAKLERLISDNGIEILQTTPSVLSFHLDNLVNPNSFSGLKFVMLAGEQLPLSLVDRLKAIAPDCVVFNGYGPSETTIFSTVFDVSSVDRVCIGRPIGNYSIFILNRNRKLLPKNFQGEIFIAGDGVGKGYLGLDELTASKFTSCPFVPNLRMYESGDIGFWRDNGTIVCKGRLDHQVKLNGLRIELGEIEGIINGFMPDNLLKSAVIVKNVSGKDSLHAFVSYPGELDVSALRKFVLDFLPNYMVPNSFTILKELPFTPNGKIDRKALSGFDIDFASGSSSVSAPRNDVEEILLGVFKKKLNAESFGIDSNIFDFGADSLTIISIITELFKYDFNLKVSDLYKYSTIRELSDELLHSSSIRGSLDFAELESLNSVVAGFSKETLANSICDKRSVFLTGATGFLGAHILAELLDDCSKVKRIYCAVRPKKGISPRQRLLDKLHFYFGNAYDVAFDKFVVIVDCQISKDCFGLCLDDFSALQKDVDLVIHCAANVKHYGKYSSFEDINVDGTKHIIEFCKPNNIALHYISTMTVSGNYLLKQDDASLVFDEFCFYVGQNFDQNVYSKSKLIAESLVIKAISDGLTATIYRVGDLTGRYSDGVFQENINQNAIYLRLKSILEIGSIPSSIVQNDLEFSPVDSVARAIKMIVWSDNNRNRIFNVFNPNFISTRLLLDFMESSDYPISVLDKDEFAKLISSLSQSSDSSDMLLGIIDDFTDDKDLVYNYTIRQFNDVTCKYLSSLGFEWPVIDEPYLRKIIDYMKKVNFIK